MMASNLMPVYHGSLGVAQDPGGEAGVRGLQGPLYIRRKSEMNAASLGRGAVRGQPA